MRHPLITPGIIALAWGVAAPHAAADPTITYNGDASVLLRLVAGDGPCRVTKVEKPAGPGAAEGKAEPAPGEPIDGNADGEEWTIGGAETHRITLGEGAGDVLFALRDDPRGLLGTIHVSRKAGPAQSGGGIRLEWTGNSGKALLKVQVLDGKYLVIDDPGAKATELKAPPKPKQEEEKKKGCTA